MSALRLLHPRAYSGSVHLDNGTLLITGGGIGDTMATSELLDLDGGGSVEGPSLPEVKNQNDQNFMVYFEAFEVKIPFWVIKENILFLIFTIGHPPYDIF